MPPAGASPLGRRAIGSRSRERAGSAFRQFVEFAPDAIVGVSAGGEIVLFNQQAERVFGYGREEIVGESIERLIPGRFHEAHARHRGRYFEDPGTRPMGAGLQLFGRRKDGTEFPAEISLSSIETEDGTLATAAVRDVSDRIAAERERAALEAQLSQSQRLESIGQLAGGVAHDFNNLLGVILNCATFVQRAIEPDGQVAEDVEEIRRAAERGSTLTRQLLIFSRRDVVRPEVLGLEDVIADVQSLLRRALGEHIELRLDLAGDLDLVEADRGQMEQVLLNLAVNARDAMLHGGRLTIATHGRRFAAGDHPELPAGRYVEVAVSDTGEGMDPEVAERAFEPFFTTKRKGEGSGLGLAMVYGILRQARGHVTIESTPGHGTTVRFLLPATGSRPATAADVGRPSRRGDGATILVVEDEPSVRRMTLRILRGAGYEVVEARSGPEALDLLAGGRSIDLVLTDILMPTMLGTELAARLVDTRPGLPVAFMSGYTDDRVRPGDGGEPVRLLEKPFGEESLLAFVAEELRA